MTVSTRTPEGFPSRCPLCRAVTKIEFSGLTLDAPCPNCGQLLWLEPQKESRVPCKSFEMVVVPEHTTVTTTFSRVEHQNAANAPQFGVRLLFVVLTTCAMAFAILGAQSHHYLNVLAETVIVFWIGTSLSFAGAIMDGRGDAWLTLAAVAESIGECVVVIAMFTGLYYGAMFILTAIT